MTSSFVGNQLMRSVEHFISMNEVQEVVQEMINTLELESNMKLLKEARSEARGLREQLMKAHDDFATMESEKNVLIRERREDKFEARVLKNRLRAEIGDVIIKLQEGEKYKEEVKILKMKLKRKDKWLKSLNYNSPNVNANNDNNVNNSNGQDDSNINHIDQQQRRRNSGRHRRVSLGDRIQVNQFDTTNNNNPPTTTTIINNSNNNDAIRAKRNLFENKEQNGVHNNNNNNEITIHTIDDKPNDLTHLEYISEDVKLSSTIRDFLTNNDINRYISVNKNIVKNNLKLLSSSSSMTKEEEEKKNNNNNNNRNVETKTLLPPPPPSYNESLNLKTNDDDKNNITSDVATPPPIITKTPEPPPPSYFSNITSKASILRNRSKTVNTRMEKTNIDSKAANDNDGNIMSKMKSMNLSNQDMRVIISIQQKLGMAEKKVYLLTSEREDLLTQLKAKASVKDFLVDKMKTKEIELAKAKEGEKLAKQQSNADREVIAFLDGRVRDLEDNVTDQGKQNELLKKELEQVKKKMQMQHRLFEDMINNVKQENIVEITQLKNEKKILVKEIKRLHSVTKGSGR